MNDGLRIRSEDKNVLFIAEGSGEVKIGKGGRKEKKEEVERNREENEAALHVLAGDS